MTKLPAASPHVTPETAPFWAATLEGRLVLPVCEACGTIIWYPRAFCPSCAGTAVSWVDAAGTGAVYSYTVVRKGQGPWADVAPYVVAYVELDEGPRLMTNIVGCEPADIEVGMRVSVIFDGTDGGGSLPRFRPTSPAAPPASDPTRRSPRE